MRCPECRKQYGRFTASPRRHLWPPSGELECPHCGAKLRVGWCPSLSFAVLMAIGIAVGIWIELWVSRNVTSFGHGRINRYLRQVARFAALAVVLAPGMYAVWVWGFYARRPRVVTAKPAEPSHPPEPPVAGT